MTSISWFSDFALYLEGYLRYSLIQMKCQGGNKYTLSITVKFDQSTIRFGRTSFARFFKLTKHTTLLFYLLSPYLLSYMRSSRNVRKNMHIIKTIMKICMHWSTVCGMTNPDTAGIQTQFQQPLGQRMICRKSLKHTVILKDTPKIML